MYNAMAYNDVRSFALTLLCDLTQRVTKEEHERLHRNSVDDEQVANKVVKILGKEKNHKVIVIDEVDQFNSNERAFTILIKAILTSSKTEKCNTSIFGIANQVDLPFRKKHSAIAMRDCQLLFKPYDYEQLVDILETKKNMLFQRLPEVMKSDQIKPIFHKLIDEKVYEFIAKKVSNLNGDIRVAFDLMKTVLGSFAAELPTILPEKLNISLQHLHRYLG